MSVLNKSRPDTDVSDVDELSEDPSTSTLTQKSAPEPRRGLLARLGLGGKKQEKPVADMTTLSDFPHLMAIKPREKIVFRSDFFIVDDNYACVLAFFHNEAANDAFNEFWGVARIPQNLGDDVTTVVLEQVRRKSESWVESKMKTAEQVNRLDEREQGTGSTSTSRRKTAKAMDDTEITTGEIHDGASYLHVHNRLYVKASSLENLDEAIDRISRLYIDRFKTLSVAPYHGEQRQELTNLLMPNEVKRGKGFHYTSVELAGSHALITNGLSDETGEYVGFMTGDVNNSAVLLDVNAYDHHVVVADGRMNKHMDRIHFSDLWGSKISQAALMENGRTVHLILNAADLDKMGPAFDGFTSRVDMNSGDVNMFEMFGDVDDELSIFPAHLEKIVLMTEQAFEPTDSDRSIIRNELKTILNQFYIEQRMWYENAKVNRDKLRLVNLRHESVPKLEMFTAYLDSAYKSQVAKTARDDAVLHAYSVLRGVFADMLNSNGDLFNSQTKDAIDTVREDRRVIYDFSQLLRRGEGVAMAQLVNIIGFAVGNLGEGDTVIIHGAEHIDDGIKEYTTRQLDFLFRRGGRVAYVYNDVDKMLADSEFNRIDEADYSVLGTMRENTVKSYQKIIGQNIPDDLSKLVTARGDLHTYLRRGVTNVVFYADLALGIDRVRPKGAGLEETAALPPGMSTVGSRDELSRRSQETQRAVTETREQHIAKNGARARLEREKDQDRQRRREVLTAAGKPRMLGKNAGPRSSEGNRPQGRG